MKGFFFSKIGYLTIEMPGAFKECSVLLCEHRMRVSMRSLQRHPANEFVYSCTINNESARDTIRFVCDNVCGTKYYLKLCRLAMLDDIYYSSWIACANVRGSVASSVYLAFASPFRTLSVSLFQWSILRRAQGERERDSEAEQL